MSKAILSVLGSLIGVSLGAWTAEWQLTGTTWRSVSLCLVAAFGAVFFARDRLDKLFQRRRGLPTSAEWLEQEQRFAEVPGEVQLTWQVYRATGLVKWSVHQQTAHRDRKTGTARDRDRFLEECRAAGALIRRLGEDLPARFTSQASTDVGDDWLNAVAAVTDSRNEMTGSGSDGIGELGLYDSGVMSDAVHASRNACATLAARAKRQES